LSAVTCFSSSRNGARGPDAPAAALAAVWSPAPRRRTHHGLLRSDDPAGDETEHHAGDAEGDGSDFISAQHIKRLRRAPPDVQILAHDAGEAHEERPHDRVAD
jgi:hypothetical protein